MRGLYFKYLATQACPFHWITKFFLRFTYCQKLNFLGAPPESQIKVLRCLQIMTPSATRVRWLLLCIPSLCFFSSPMSFLSPRIRLRWVFSWRLGQQVVTVTQFSLQEPFNMRPRRVGHHNESWYLSAYWAIRRGLLYGDWNPIVQFGYWARPVEERSLEQEPPASPHVRWSLNRYPTFYMPEGTSGSLMTITLGTRLVTK